MITYFPAVRVDYSFRFFFSSTLEIAISVPETRPTPESVPLPQSFWGYLTAFGPGLVVVLTWLGAGDIVDMGVAGGNYGYALMWVLVIAVVMRYLFVSLIAKYQLCNQHQEGVLDGLVRLHPGYGPLLLAAAVIIGHVNGAYMLVGIGEACRNVTGFGAEWIWAGFWSFLALGLLMRSAYERMEVIFKLLMALLSISLVGTAIWVRPDLVEVVRGLVSVDVPEQTGDFGPLLVAMAMIGAVGGSLMNLVYPYFLESKGWRGPRFRRIQRYDFLLAILVMMALNLSVWILGAELLHPHGLTVSSMDDLPWLLSLVLGPAGRLLFYLGIFAAIYTSLIGHALGLACLGSHAYRRMFEGVSSSRDYRSMKLYWGIVAWCLISPLIWTTPGMPDFVTLTLVVNGAQVLLLPLIAGGLWWITASATYIGPRFQNRWWENLVMGVLFVLAVSGAIGSVRSLTEANSANDTVSATELDSRLERTAARLVRNLDGQITGVDLSQTDANNRDLEDLKLLTQLNTLNLMNCQISDIGLYHLKSLRSLERLDVRGTQVTDQGVATLRQSLPECRIELTE